MTEPAPEDAARQEGRRAIEATVLRMAHIAGGQIQERPAYPGANWTRPQPTPSDGIRYATFLRDSATATIREHVREARRQGLTWAQVGEVLGLREAAEERGALIADLAFDYASDAEHHWPVVQFPWRCPVCDGLVSDRGPSNGSPHDNEPGHVEGCARFAALVAEHDARLEDGE